MSCCEPRVGYVATDAREIPFRSFAFINSVTLFKPNCDAEPCLIDTEAYTSSGVFVLRSTKSSSIAYVLTARHMCDHVEDRPKNSVFVAHRFDIRDYDGTKHQAHAIFRSISFDACIMLVTNVGSNIDIAPVSKNQVMQGERVFNISAPHGFSAKHMTITFEGLYSGENVNGLLYTTPVAPGSSGSPVFNTKGRLVSMLWGFPTITLNEDGQLKDTRVMESIAYGLRLNEIDSMMKELLAFDSALNPIEYE